MVIRRDSLDEFCSRELGTFKINFTMVNILGKVAGDILVLEAWLPPLGT